VKRRCSILPRHLRDWLESHPDQWPFPRLRDAGAAHRIKVQELRQPIELFLFKPSCLPWKFLFDALSDAGDYFDCMRVLLDDLV
jgi:hypothetical protein